MEVPSVTWLFEMTLSGRAISPTSNLHSTNIAQKEGATFHQKPVNILTYI